LLTPGWRAPGGREPRWLGRARRFQRTSGGEQRKHERRRRSSAGSPGPARADRLGRRTAWRATERLGRGPGRPGARARAGRARPSDDGPAADQPDRPTPGAPRRDRRRTAMPTAWSSPP